MTGSKKSIFPFAEFDPVLRRNLAAVYEAARRDLEEAETSIGDRRALHDWIIERICERAREGQRDPLQLYDEVVGRYFVQRSCGTA